ncbi:MAG: hypothetical protein HKP58_06485 [Desulfatitalea sp.]|nr:metallophosphoesterase [Desulfatitalea sp.]NNK00044.1 hypothetical protein [Desulfatitalea sp.]
MNIKKIQRTFADGCFKPLTVQPGPKHLKDPSKQTYIVKAGETLEQIADQMKQAAGQFKWIGESVKQPDTARYEHAWQCIADYNYGTIDPPALNWSLCVAHGFEEQKNLTADKKNYTYKGGEKLYYPVRVQKGKTGRMHVKVVQDDTPGVIVHPSFGCPALVGEDSMLSLLVMADPKKGKIIPEKVNLHLKILPWDTDIGTIKNGLVQRKSYDGFAPSLFASAGEAKKNILVEKIDLKEYIEDKNGRFSFIPEKKVIETYKDYGYKDLYRIDIHLKYLPFKERFLQEGFYNLFWINHGLEREDEMIQRKLGHYLGKKIYRSDNGKWYGFAVEKRGLFFDKLQPKYPICSYHPVLYKKKKFYNIAHMGDLHLVARLTLMKKNTAKVVEADGVATVGDMLNDHFDNVVSLFIQAGKDDDIDMVLISGDLIDALKSFYPTQFVDQKNKYMADGEYGYASEMTLENYYQSPSGIWDAVGVKDKDETNKKYQDGVDLITIYSIILNFYLVQKKPVFIVSGNHDAYHWPYGVSPRLFNWSKHLCRKANEGIPADMNLTIYESILAYGDKYDKIIQRLDEPSLKKEKFDLFYTMFTPMRDFALMAGDFALIGLSWGDDEDKLGINDRHEQGAGHLPRADDAISDLQLKRIVDFAINKNRGKNILFSHFTFVSYKEKHSLKAFKEGDVEFDWHWEANQFDMGTFETNRKKIYEKYLAKEKKLHYVLSGHSHRRGLYEITDVDYKGDNSVKTRFYGFTHFAKTKGPRIIVSDSAGPIPRWNYDGEFAGWGSTLPSYTKMVFDDSGELKDLKAVVSGNTKGKPRFAVALDYLYLIEKIDFIDSITTDAMTKWAYVKMTQLTFQLKWAALPGKKAKLLDLKRLKPARVELHAYYDGRFHKFPCHLATRGSNGTASCTIGFNNRRQTEKFKLQVVNSSQRNTFLSLSFKSLDGPDYLPYNYGSPYIFEVQIKDKDKGDQLVIVIDRNRNHNEIPNLKWRKKYYKDKYVG